MRKLTKTRAVVLRKKSLPQGDILVTFLTQDYGKTVGLAKGARALSSRRAPHLQTGNYLEVQFDFREDSAFIRQTALLSAFGGLKFDYRKLPYVYTYLFVLEKLLPERQQELGIYDQCIAFLSGLTRIREQKSQYTEAYLVRALTTLGYQCEPGHQLVGYLEELCNAKLPLHDIMQ